MKSSKDTGWSPYLAGGLTGIVAILSVWIADKFYGVSSTFPRIAGLIEKYFLPERVATLEYYTKIGLKIDWQTMFIAGIFIGAFIAAITSRTFKLVSVPDTWRSRFGPGILKRGFVAFAGGAIAIFGARLADG